MCDSDQFDIPLILTGDDSAFRIKDAPGGEVHRLGAVEQSVSGLILQGNLKEVIHGTLTPNGPPATLVIMEFGFIKMHSISIHRFRQVTIKLRFFTEPNGGGTDPTVIKIAPYGEYGFNQTVLHKEVRHLARAGIQSGGELGIPATLGVAYERETQLTREITDRGSISGVITHDQVRSWGGKNVAQWCATENHDKRSGVPTSIRVAVLLQRKKKAGRFLMETNIDAKVDVLYGIKESFLKVFGRLGNDAITFDPDPQHALSTERTDLDSKNLASCNLENEMHIQVDPKLVQGG